MTTIPSKMCCIEISEPGEPSVLKDVERPVPEPKNNEILIKVGAAGINRPDVLQRKGLYPPPPDASDLPGLEVAGVIVKIGPSVTDFQIGDEVCALTPGGGYAEYCVAPQEQSLHIPKGLTAIEAAAIPETFFTVWFNLFIRGGLHAGQSLLVHGGTSGIGTTAIQIAKSFGVKVFITAGTDKKCTACLKLGADVAINYNNEDFVEVVAKENNKLGVNMLVDLMGGDYIQRNLSCLAKNGQLINLFYLNGSTATVNFTPVLINGLTMTGSVLRPQPLDVKATIRNGLKESIWPLIENNTVRPVIYQTFPLSDASKAHELMESSQHIGKIVLTV